MSRNGRGPDLHLRLEDMSDPQLLELFARVASRDGGALAIEVAEEVGGVRMSRAVGQRFSWYKRWGYMEQDGKDKRWFLTPEGVALYRGAQLTATQERSLQILAERALGLGDQLGQRLDSDNRRMLTRQLRYHAMNRR